MIQSDLGRRVAALMAFVAIVAAMFIFGAPLCPVAIVTHHPCPGCGLTRATSSILHGDFLSAMRLHPLAPFLTPLVIWSMGRNAIGFVRTGAWGAGDGAGDWMTWVAAVLLFAMIGLWIARFFGFWGGPVPV